VIETSSGLDLGQKRVEEFGVYPTLGSTKGLERVMCIYDEEHIPTETQPGRSVIPQRLGVRSANWGSWTPTWANSRSPDGFVTSSP